MAKEMTLTPEMIAEIEQTPEFEAGVALQALLASAMILARLGISHRIIRQSVEKILAEHPQGAKAEHQDAVLRTTEAERAARKAYAADRSNEANRVAFLDALKAEEDAEAAAKAAGLTEAEILDIQYPRVI